MALLSPAQQAAFQQTLQDPSKVSALVSAEFLDEPPWWIKSDKATKDDDGNDSESGNEEADDLPPILREEQLPPLKAAADGSVVGRQLVYNVVAVLYVVGYGPGSAVMLTYSTPAASRTRTRSAPSPSRPSHPSGPTQPSARRQSTCFLNSYLSLSKNRPWSSRTRGARLNMSSRARSSTFVSDPSLAELELISTFTTRPSHRI